MIIPIKNRHDGEKGAIKLIWLIWELNSIISINIGPRFWQRIEKKSFAQSRRAPHQVKDDEGDLKKLEITWTKRERIDKFETGF